MYLKQELSKKKDFGSLLKPETTYVPHFLSYHPGPPVKWITFFFSGNPCTFRASVVLPETSYTRTNVLYRRWTPFLPHSDPLLISKATQNCTEVECRSPQPPRRRFSPFAMHTPPHSSDHWVEPYVGVLGFKQFRFPLGMKLTCIFPVTSLD